MMEQAFLPHFVPGRLRLKVPERRGDGDYFRWLQESLLALPRVKGVSSVNPVTGSVLLEHAWPAAEDVARDCQQQQLLHVSAARSEALWRRGSSMLDTVKQRLPGSGGKDEMQTGAGQEGTGQERAGRGGTEQERAGQEKESRRSGNTLASGIGLRRVLMVAMVLMGTTQVARGQILAPAATLFWYALELAGLPEDAPGKDAGGAAK